MREFDYYRPQNLAELKENLSHPGARVLAGGTDIIPNMRQGKFDPAILVDASGLTSLRFIEDQGDQIVIGALTTHQEIAESQLIGTENPALREASECIGSIQTRCRGTLGGNIVNASPAADTLPPLLISDAAVLIQNLNGERLIPLKTFVLGPGKTDLGEGEFIHSVTFPTFKGRWGSKFIKVGKRSGMAISVVNAAAAVILDEEDRIAEARIALGAVGQVVIRCRETEKHLVGNIPGGQLFAQFGEKVKEEIRPITDIRSSENYRLHSAAVIAGRALEAAAEQAGWRQR